MELGSAATAWWVAAGVLVLVELFTGSIYLLMVALGLVAAGLLAWLGSGMVAQLLAASLVGGAATLAWHFHGVRSSPKVAAMQDRDVNLDIGERIYVSAWGPDGMARVNYRGSAWQARLAPGATAEPGLHVVIAMEGNRLVLSPVAS